MEHHSPDNGAVKPTNQPPPNMQNILLIQTNLPKIWSQKPKPYLSNDINLSRTKNIYGNERCEVSEKGFIEGAVTLLGTPVVDGIQRK